MRASGSQSLQSDGTNGLAHKVASRLQAMNQRGLLHERRVASNAVI